MRGNMTFWALNPYYKRSNWPIEKPGNQKDFLKLYHLSFEIQKIYMLSAEAYRNEKLNYTHPLWFYEKSSKMYLNMVMKLDGRVVQV